MSRMHHIAGKMRHLSGWKHDRPDHRDMPLKLFPPGTIIAPVSDLRSKSPRVEDQGDIGSCTANASTSAMEYRTSRRA